MRMVSLPSIAELLARYEDRYRWVDLFVRDIDFAASSQALYKLDDTHYRARLGGKRLDITVYPDRGVARFGLSERRDDQATPLAGGAALGALSGAAVAAIAARKPDTSGVVLGLLVGGLIGAALGAAQLDHSRVMTLQYEPGTDRWRVYHGPLLTWAKQALRTG